MKIPWVGPKRQEVISSCQNPRYGIFTGYNLYFLLGEVWEDKKIFFIYNMKIFLQANVPKNARLREPLDFEKFVWDAITFLTKEERTRGLIMRTKQQDIFCLFDSKTTFYPLAKPAWERDHISQRAKSWPKTGLGFWIYHLGINLDYSYALLISLLVFDEIGLQEMKYNLKQLKELFSNYGKTVPRYTEEGLRLQAEKKYNKIACLFPG